MAEFKGFADFMEELSKKLLAGDIYENPSQKKKAFYDSLKEMHNDWRSKKTCMYPGCTNESIRNSHTIQENGPLKLIAEGGNNDTVLSPEVHNGILGLREKKIALSSVFPGFCSDHEDVFKEFESKKRIENDIDHSLQVFRSICRHLYMLKNRYKYFVKQKNEKAQKKLDTAKKLLGEYSLMSSKVSDTVKSVRDQDDETFEIVIGEIEGFIKEADELYNASVVDLLNKKVEELYIFTFLISDKLFPVCLSGVGNLISIRDGESSPKNISVIMNILPQDKDTRIMAAVHKDYASDLNEYLQNFINSDLGIINLIESWMVYGTDHWFISPSIWGKIPPERQNKILTELDSTTKDIRHHCPYSILDEIRTEAIERNEQFIDVEKRKMI
ncbi:hypothetical protein [Neobacillus niacini]|uniref:hypothetical protein n=1 Tax=Neobacillus niacini TaxID=86668 RepID=UPI003983D4BE